VAGHPGFVPSPATTPWGVEFTMAATSFVRNGRSRTAAALFCASFSIAFAACGGGDRQVSDPTDGNGN